MRIIQIFPVVPFSIRADRFPTFYIFFFIFFFLLLFILRGDDASYRHHPKNPAILAQTYPGLFIPKGYLLCSVDVTDGGTFIIMLSINGNSYCIHNKIYRPVVGEDTACLLVRKTNTEEQKFDYNVFNNDKIILVK